MKIGIVCPYNMYRAGGVQEVVLAQHKELTARGHNVTILAPKPKEVPEAELPGVRLVGQSTEVKFKAPFHTTLDVAASMGPREIASILNEEKFDVMHFHEPWMPMMPYQLLQRSSAVNIGTIHAKLPESIVNKSITKAITPYVKSAIKRLHALTAVSEVAAESAEELFHEKIEIIPNGIDLSFYHAEHIHRLPDYNDDVKTILYVGRLENRKGVQYLVKAFGALQANHPDTRLLIAGSGHKDKSLKNLVEKLEINNVEFLGYIDDETKRRLMKTCDVFCSPAPYGESFGIVLLEAMAMGAICVAGNNPGYSSVMRDRGRLSLIDPKSTQDFAHRLELMLYDEPIRKLWHEWAQEYVTNFDYPNVIDQYEAVYNSAIKRYGK